MFSSNSFWRCLVSAQLITAGLSPAAVAQDPATRAATGATLRGRVIGKNDLPLVSARINVFGAASTETDDKGEFSLSDLPRGTYVVEIIAVGYTPRRIPMALSDTTPFLRINMEGGAVVLEAEHIVARRSDDTKDVLVSEAELAAPAVVGGSAYDAITVLRPQFLATRAPTAAPLPGTKRVSASQRGQDYRDPATPDPQGEGGGKLTVSVDEGGLQNIDILKHLAVRNIREMRYLRPIEATARFGVSADGGPVLIVYTMK